MTAIQFIKEFREACEREYTFLYRKSAIETQFNRQAWQIIYPEIGMLKISTHNNDSLFLADLYCSIGNRRGLKTHEDIQLTRGQFLALFNLYKADFKPNLEYLKRIGAIK